MSDEGAIGGTLQCRYGSCSLSALL